MEQKATQQRASGIRLSRRVAGGRIAIQSFLEPTVELKLLFASSDDRRGTRSLEYMSCIRRILLHPDFVFSKGVGFRYPAAHAVTRNGSEFVDHLRCPSFIRSLRRCGLHADDRLSFIVDVNMLDPNLRRSDFTSLRHSPP